VSNRQCAPIIATGAFAGWGPDWWHPHPAGERGPGRCNCHCEFHRSRRVGTQWRAMNRIAHGFLGGPLHCHSDPDASGPRTGTTAPMHRGMVCRCIGHNHGIPRPAGLGMTCEITGSLKGVPMKSGRRSNLLTLTRAGDCLVPTCRDEAMTGRNSQSTTCMSRCGEHVHPQSLF